MMIPDKLNCYDHGGYRKMTVLFSNVIVTNKSKSKRSIANKKLSQSGSTNEKKSISSIVNETLSQNCSAKENELCFTKEERNKKT